MFGLRNNESTPSHVSADLRLAEFVGKTMGLKLGVEFSNASKFIVRLEIFKQTGDARPDDAIGIQQNDDLFSILEATIVQVSFSKIF